MNKNNRSNTLIHHIKYLLQDCRSRPSDDKKEAMNIKIQKSKNELKILIEESKSIQDVEEALIYLNASIKIKNNSGPKLENSVQIWAVEKLNEILKKLGNLAQPLPDLPGFEAKFGKHGIESNLQHNIVKHSYIDDEIGFTKDELTSHISLLVNSNIPQNSSRLGEKIGEHNISLNFKPYIVSINNASINTYMKNKENKGLKR